MLVLQRKEGESITLDDGVNIVKIVFFEQSSKGKIRLGIEAPEHIKIHRTECLKAGIKDEVEN